MNGIFCVLGDAHCFSAYHWVPWRRVWQRSKCAVQGLLCAETESLSNQGYCSLLSLALPLSRGQPSKGLSHTALTSLLFLLPCFSRNMCLWSLLCGGAESQTEGSARSLWSVFNLFLFSVHKLCSFSCSSFPMSIKTVTCDGTKII